MIVSNFNVFELKSGKNDILDDIKDAEVILSKTINEPMCSLGFHTFMHRTKTNLNISIKAVKSDNEFYYVINPWEPIISNYEDTLQSASKAYLKANNSNREFYKYWEMLTVFDMIDLDKKSFDCICMGSDIEQLKMCSEKYKQMFSKSPSINIKSINISPSGYKKEYYDKMLDVKSDKADLILCNGEIEPTNINYEEQEMYQMILGEIIMALSKLDEGGNMILKINETFTIPTIKLVYIISSFFKNNFMYKPFYSRPTSAEKYLICKGFNKPKNLDKKIASLIKIYKSINDDKFVFDIYPAMDISKSYVDNFRFMNIKLSNTLQIVSNDIMVYIKENNYFGEKYHESRDQQIQATQFWTQLFYPPSVNQFNISKDTIKKMLKNTEEKYKAEQGNLFSNLVFS